MTDLVKIGNYCSGHEWCEEEKMIKQLVDNVEEGKLLIERDYLGRLEQKDHVRVLTKPTVDFKIKKR